MEILSRPPTLLPLDLRIRRPRIPRIASAAKRGTFRRAASSSSSSGGDARRPWWAPLVREDAEPEEDPAAAKEAPEAGDHRSSSSAEAVRRSRLTAEKARVLRREIRATETWRDAMYHSAIASRLASPDDP